MGSSDLTRSQGGVGDGVRKQVDVEEIAGREADVEGEGGGLGAAAVGGPFRDEPLDAKLQAKRS